MSGPPRAAAGLVLGLLGGLAVPGPVCAEVRALVIGIDRYQHVASLHGAVADAQDVAQALERAGVRDLTLLLDEQAGFNAVRAAWEGVVERAQKGDQIVFTFAGHGSQWPERVLGSEEDHQDEFLVLGGFANEGVGLEEQILDDVLNVWFRNAGLKGAKVLAAVDACHSGTAFRKPDSRVRAPTYRFADIPITDAELEIPLPPEEKGVDEGDLPHVSWLAGAQDYQTVPEIEVPGPDGASRKGGALSWSLARAVEGAADVDGDGTLTRGELFDFVDGKVRSLAEARQTPNFWPLGARDTPLMPVPRPPLPEAGTADAPIRLAVINDDDGSVAPMLKASLRRARLVGEPAQAEVVWDVRARQVVTALGDVAAEGIAASELQQVVDKELALRRLRSSTAAGQLRTRVLPDDGTHRAGATIEVTIDGFQQPYLTLFNLAGSGAVQFLFPAEGDPPRVPVGRPFALGVVEVVPPFGADHIVVVATERAPDALRARLQALDQRPAAIEAVKAVLALVGERGTQLGVQGIFTAAR